MTSVAAVQAEIEDRLRQHLEALARHDTDAALELFAKDAILRPANAEPLRGVAALREFFERAFAAMSFGDGRFFTEELYLYDSMAFHFGTYQLSAGPVDGGGIREKGSFAIVWRRDRDGAWRYRRGVLNSSRGAPRAPERES